MLYNGETLQPPPGPPTHHPAHKLHLSASVGQHKVVVEAIIISTRTLVKQGGNQLVTGVKLLAAIVITSSLRPAA